MASGKTVVGRLLAQRLGFRFLDTGAMYRAVTLAALRKGIDLADEEALTRLADSLELRLVPGDSGDRLLMDGEDVTDLLRQQKVERGVSLVARVPGVRAAMVRQQQAIAREGPVVMVGRDIGTVVLPDARVKVFLKASVDVRARRRYEELRARGLSPDYQEVRADLLRRDKLDTERSASPLRPAEGAVQIDTDNLSIEEVAQRVVAILHGGNSGAPEVQGR